MNNTMIKTRYGLILQGLLAEALKIAGFTYRENWQYASDCECPDFTMPDSDYPAYLIEVHQTDSRDSFRMKVLRAFTAVCEAKAYLNKNITTINVLFGDPSVEVPESNIKALFSFFDSNIIPAQHNITNNMATKIEQAALLLAKNDKLNVSEAVKQIIIDEKQALNNLALIIKEVISKPRPQHVLDNLWQMEIDRRNSLELSQCFESNTYLKRSILKSLYLSEVHFKELVNSNNSNTWSDSLKNQLIKLRLGISTKTIAGEKVILDNDFKNYVESKQASKYRTLCDKELSSKPRMLWFFEDIRDADRRSTMVLRFLDVLSKGKNELISELLVLFNSNKHADIAHNRNWIADLMAIYAKSSQNEFNRRMVQTKRDPSNYQNPFNHIASKSDWFSNDHGIQERYAISSVEVFYEFCKEKKVNYSTAKQAVEELDDRLLELRLNGAIKLQKFNPLYIILEEVANELGLNIEHVHEKSLIYDLSGGDGRLGKNDVIKISNGKTSVVAKIVAVHDHHGDDKSKEWAARRLSLLYRLKDGKLITPTKGKGVFIIDGEWKQKDINRLYRAGWNYIIPLVDIKDELSKIFGL